MSRRIAQLCAAGLVALGGILAVAGAIQWTSAWSENLSIDALTAGKTRKIASDAAPIVLAAQARALMAHGRFDDAQAIADRLTSGSQSGHAAAVLYALGNARLRHALEIFNSVPFRKVKPELSLAKADYRAALQADPGDWDARYNYALAAALLPDVEQYQHSSGAQMSHDRATWPDIPGAPNGMP